MKNKDIFEKNLKEATNFKPQGWDFSNLEGRMVYGGVEWDYEKIVRSYLGKSQRLLDMGTGGGEFLKTLAPLPSNTFATEGYPPNIAIAKTTLEPLGVRVVQVSDREDDQGLPLESSYFDLVINRHESYEASEVYRVLKSGGVFIHQSVGGRNKFDINQLFGMDLNPAYTEVCLESSLRDLAKEGFRIISGLESFPKGKIFDIGALVMFLKLVPWQVEGFSLERHMDYLVKIHDVIQEQGFLEFTSHRFLVVAEKP